MTNVSIIFRFQALFQKRKFSNKICINYSCGYEYKMIVIFIVHSVVKRLIVLSRILNCYKISLECNDSNVSWYSSMGFVREQGNSNFMQIRLENS